jgi:adhesin/invasin
VGAAVLAVLMTFVGLAVAPASGATTGSVALGEIRGEGGGVDRVLLDADMQSQLWTPASPTHGAYFEHEVTGRTSTEPMVRVASGARFEGSAGALVGQDHGGTGTREDPYWISTTREVAGTMRVTKTDLYAVGARHVESRLSYTNLGSVTEDAQVGYWYDCFFSGDDRGSVALTPTSASCVGSDPETGGMHLVAVSPDPVVIAGQFLGVRAAAATYGTPSGCVDADGNRPGCGTLGSVDNAFAVTWRAQGVAPGATVTRTWLARFGDEQQVADLAVAATVTPATGTVARGAQVTYRLSVDSTGPDAAADLDVRFALPEGVTYVGQSGSGGYDPVTGSWSVGLVEPGRPAAVEIVARAATAGTWEGQITSASSASSIDPTPCLAGSTRNCGASTSVTVAATLDAGASTLAAAPLQVAADGVAASTLTVTVLADDGAPLGVGGTPVSISSDLGTVGPVADHGDGTYSARVISTVAGTASTSAVVAGATLAGPRVTFVAGAPSVSHTGTALSVTTGRAVADGADAQTVTAAVVDAHGNPVAGAAVRFAPVAPLSAVTPVAVATGEDGTATVDVVSLVAGGHAVTATVAGVPVVHGSPAVAVFGAGHAAVEHTGTALSVTSRDAVADGADTQTVTVSVVDGQGNAVPGAPVVVEPAAGLLATSSVSGTTGGDGTFAVTVTSTSAGSYPVTASVGGTPVLHGSPAVAVFRAGAPSVQHQGTALTVTQHDAVADGVDAHAVTVRVVDAHGNPVPGSRVAFDVPTALTAATAAAGVSGADGTFAMEVTSAVPGSHEVTATVDGTAVRHGSPAVAVFRADTVDPAHVGTALSVTTRDAVADGVDPQTVTVTAADARGSRLPAVAVQVSLAPGLVPAAGSAVAGTTDEAGVFVLDVVSTVAGAHEVTAVAGGSPVVHGSPAVAQFRAGAPLVEPLEAGGPVSGYSVTEGERPVGAVHEVDVRLVDGSGNPVTGRAADLVVVSPDPLGDGGVGPVSEVAAGVYRAEIASTEPGDKAVGVTVAGAVLVGAPGANTVARFAVPAGPDEPGAPGAPGEPGEPGEPGGGDGATDEPGAGAVDRETEPGPGARGPEPEPGAGGLGGAGDDTAGSGALAWTGATPWAGAAAGLGLLLLGALLVLARRRRSDGDRTTHQGLAD